MQFSIKNNLLEECLDKNSSIKSLMLQIAEEKNNYYTCLKDELQIKYKSERVLEQLYHDKKGEEWTNYMSLKRQMVKKNQAMQNKIGRTLLTIGNQGKNDQVTVDESDKKIAKEQKKRRLEKKKAAAALGSKR